MNTMTKTIALSLALVVSGASLAGAQTTLGGDKKDNSASGGKENGTTAGSGKGTMTKGGSMMKAAPKASASKGTATGGTPGGKPDKN